MISKETNELLAVLMDTPGLRQEQIGPMLRKLRDVANDAPKYSEEMDGFYCVIHDMLEAWEG